MKIATKIKIIKRCSIPTTEGVVIMEVGDVMYIRKNINGLLEENGFIYCRPSIASQLVDKKCANGTD